MLTKEQVIERLSLFGFSFEKEAETYGFSPDRDNVIDAMIFSSNGSKVLVFKSEPYFTSYWYARLLTESSIDDRGIYIAHRGKYYSYDIAEVERTSILKNIKLIVRFESHTVFDDIFISIKRRLKPKHHKADSILFGAMLRFTVRDKEVEQIAFQYMQEKMEPGIFMDYLREKYPELLEQIG